MQINQQIISGFIESGLNWLTEQVAGRLNPNQLQPNGQSREFQIGIDLVNMTDDQKHALGIAIRKELWVVREEMQKSQPPVQTLNPVELQLNDTLADFIHEQMKGYNWGMDEGLEDVMNGRISSHFLGYDWDDDPANILGQIESVVKEELEDDLEDKVRDVFNSRSIVEDYIRDNPSSFRDSIESILRDDPSIVRDVIAQDSDIDQTLRNCLKDNPDIIRDHLESTEGRSTMRLAMESVINEAVSTRMRSIFESMSRNI